MSAAVTRGLETFLVLAHGEAIETDPRGPEAGGFADYARESYDFDWDAAHPGAPYARMPDSTCREENSEAVSISATFVRRSG